QLLSSSDFMDDMRERFAFLCSQKGISFLFNSAAFSYYADEHLLQRCVSNIIQNAIQHTEAGGQISVNFYDRDSQAVLEVRNSGHIDERHLEHVFDRFYRGDKARNPSGSGLGLPIVKAIMNLHNGTAEVKNCGDMVCVTLTFPEIFDLL
ncbi:MAG: sensor histidine kinase, partial [Spirochaetaceae bacterium]|nr:sensor histidine kinase [Spirochaetaceae bacterium]